MQPGQDQSRDSAKGKRQIPGTRVCDESSLFLLALQPGQTAPKPLDAAPALDGSPASVPVAMLGYAAADCRPTRRRRRTMPSVTREAMSQVQSLQRSLPPLSRLSCTCEPSHWRSARYVRRAG